MISKSLHHHEHKAGRVCSKHQLSELFKERILYDFGRNDYGHDEKESREECTCSYLKSAALVILCEHCNGNGYSEGFAGKCHQCGGRGSLFIHKICQLCAGSGVHSFLKRYECHQCNGAGFETLMRQESIESFLFQSEECQYCHGTGRGPIRRCIVCNGARCILTFPGKIRCATCVGSGKKSKKKCDVCGGSGWAFYKLQQVHKYHDQYCNQ